MALNVNAIQNESSNIAEEELKSLALRGGAPVGPPTGAIDPAGLTSNPNVPSYAGATPQSVLDGIKASGVDPSAFGEQAAIDYADYQAYQSAIQPEVQPLAGTPTPSGTTNVPLTPIPATGQQFDNANERIIDRETGLPLADPQQAQRDSFALNEAELSKNEYGKLINNARDIESVAKQLSWKDSNKKKTFANNMAFNQKTLLSTPVKTIKADGTQTAVKGITYLMDRSGFDAQQVALSSEMARIQIAKIIAPLNHAVKAKNKENDIAGVYDDLGSGEDSLLPFHTEDGRIGVEAESFERNMGSQYRGIIDQATQDPERRLTPNEAENRLLVNTMLKNGDIVEDTHQPTKGDGTPVGAKVKAYFITPKLMRDFNQFRELSDVPGIRIGATKATGINNKHIGPISQYAKGDTKRPSGQSKDLIKSQKKDEDNAFQLFFDTLKNASRGYNSEVLTTDALLINQLVRIDKQIQAQKKPAETFLSPTEIAMVNLAETSLKLDKKLSMLGLEPRDFEVMEANPEAQTAFDARVEKRTTKMRQVAKKIAEAELLEKAMQGSLHKLGSGVFTDPSNMRNYVFAYNSSEQNNPFIRGALEGYSLPVSKNRWNAAKDNNTQLVSAENLGNLRSMSRNGGTKTPATREQTFLIMVGRQLIPNGRTLPDSAIIQQVNKRMIFAAASMGKALKEFNASNPSQDLLSNAVEAKVEGAGVVDNAALQKAFILMGTEPKNKGSIEQMLIATSDYVDSPDNGGVRLTFSVFPDMNSAGRLNPVLSAAGHLPSAMLGRMGMVIDQSIGEQNNYAHGLPVPESEDSSLAPFGNARELIATQFVENLDNAETEGNIEGTLAAFLKDLFGSKGGADMMDAFVKNPVMVVDYGMMISGAAKMSVESFNKMIKADPAIYSQYQEMITSINSNEAAVNESIRIYMGETLASTTNPQYSKSFQTIGLGAAILGVPLVYEGYDGVVHSVGSVQRKATGDTFVVGDSPAGMFYESEFSDETSARAKSKPQAIYDKSGKIIRYDLSNPPVYSGQIQAWSPMVGQMTERALIAKALQTMNNRFKKPHDNLLLDMHDSIGMDFEDSFHYQNILQEILPDVLDQNLPGKGAKGVFENMVAKHKEYGRLGKIEVGPGSQLDSLHTFLDESFQSTLERLRDKDYEELLPAAQKLYLDAMGRQLAVLRDAQQAGVWAPNISRDLSLLGVDFKVDTEARTGIREIDYTNQFFNKFYKKHFMDPAHKAAKKFAQTDARARKEILKMLRDIDINRLGFFRNGNETDTGWDT